jgi:hypothetical protein
MLWGLDLIGIGSLQTPFLLCKPLFPILLAIFASYRKPYIFVAYFTGFGYSVKGSFLLFRCKKLREVLALTKAAGFALDRRSQ